MTLPTDPKARKAIPVYSGFIKYFPRAICAVAELSQIGNTQHNPGKPLHWDRSKSSDELDALTRHMLDDVMGVPADTDGVLHATKLAWRAMANLEKALEARAKPMTATEVMETLRKHGHEEAWRPHDGGPMPCPPATFVEVKFKDGATGRDMADCWRWTHWDSISDILFWRPTKTK